MRPVLISLLVLLSTFAFAQLQKGNHLVGGSMYAHASNEESSDSGSSKGNDKAFQFSITPRYGYFISDKVVLGIDVGYYFEHYVSPEQTEFSYKRADYSFTPFVRNYISIGNRVALFFHSSLGIGYFKIKKSASFFDPDAGLETIINSQTDNLTGSANVNMGIAYFISTRWSVEATFASLNYGHTFKQSNSSLFTADDSISMWYGPSALNFGTTFYFNR